MSSPNLLEMAMAEQMFGVIAPRVHPAMIIKYYYNYNCLLYFTIIIIIIIAPRVHISNIPVGLCRRRSLLGVCRREPFYYYYY